MEQCAQRHICSAVQWVLDGKRYDGAACRVLVPPKIYSESIVFFQFTPGTIAVSPLVWFM